MNYTQNHHLPQWAASDRVKMEDFNAAMSSIESGLNSAYSPGNMPYVTGSYTGDGGNQNVYVGFMPSFLIISGMRESTDADDYSFERYGALVGSNGTIINQQLQHRVQLFTEGFLVFREGNNIYPLPLLNELGRKYYYIAFR